LLTPAQNPVALAAAIRRLIDDPGLRARLGTAARQTVAQFDERVVLGRLGDILDRVAEGSA
jgi:glycosyltransferase involved in cell wall biosynthesis